MRQKREKRIALKHFWILKHCHFYIKAATEDTVIDGGEGDLLLILKLAM